MGFSKVFIVALMLITATTVSRAEGKNAINKSTLKGVVIDGETKEPIIGATVIIDGKNTGDVTDVNGNFKVQSQSQEIELIISYVGYKEIRLPHRFKSNNDIISKPISLMYDPILLEEIVVRASAPTVIVKGDTTQYNASAYKTHVDATAEELLSKMSGFIVQNGVIEADGETLKYVYVDGKSYFKNDPKTALNSIPANIIKNIQLFDEKSDKSRLTGIDV